MGFLRRRREGQQPLDDGGEEGGEEEEEEGLAAPSVGAVFELCAEDVEGEGGECGAGLEEGAGPDGVGGRKGMRRGWVDQRLDGLCSRPFCFVFRGSWW